MTSIQERLQIAVAAIERDPDLRGEVTSLDLTKPNGEAAALRRARPVLPVDEVGLDWRSTGKVPTEVWPGRLHKAAAQIQGAARAVGRVELEHHDSVEQIGAGWLIHPDVIVTNRHVARRFSENEDDHLVFRNGIQASLRFSEDINDSDRQSFAVKKVLYVEPEPGPDLALAQIDAPTTILPIKLSDYGPIEGQFVAVLGYPTPTAETSDQALIQRAFGDVLDKKSIAPGQVVRTTAGEFEHDCSTLGSNSGAVVLDLASGEAVGLHVGGRFLESSRAVPADVIGQRLSNVLFGERRSRVRRDTRTKSSDDVSVSVFSPSSCRVTQPFLIQVFAHLPSESEHVKVLAVEFDDSTSRRGTKALERPVRRGTKLDLSLHVPHAEVNPPVQSLRWRGSAEAVQFEVQLRVDAPAALIGTAYVAQRSVPLGHVKFQLRVGDADEPIQPQRTMPEAFKRYRYAFVSYASADRIEVLKRVQMLPRVAIDYFNDLLTLEPGARWSQELYKHIDICDVFFLFWSSNAKASEWVMKEVAYALRLKGSDDYRPPEIIPIIIEGPPPVPPPPELQHLHFNDLFMYVIRSSERSQ